MRATLKDIAVAVGVSVITVSKVMRGHSDIGAETRRKVLEKAKELNFRPNLQARSLVTGKSQLVGLVVPDLLHPYFVEIAQSLAAELRKKGYYLVLSSSEEDRGLEEQQMEHLLALRLDALVVASCASEPPALFGQIQQQGTPLILLDRSFEDFPCDFVGSDNVQMGYLATSHLLSKKRKRIAHIRGPASSIGRGRYQGYRKAFEEVRRKLDDRYVVETSTVDVDSNLEGKLAMTRLLAVDPRPDAVFCYSDPLAIGAIDAILEAGLRVPQDVAVVGCGNLHYDTHLRVPLTSVDQKSRELGMRVAKMLLSILSSDPKVRRPRTSIQPVELILRESCH
ncbi:transcriptional regulator [Terriglobus roseus DSM 18391]|uniref:Transcriptional regulator n=1 Tax=Terriglobus roseus (strain DSM 18391 / NRRL B-41598 / KBS 63) TaxID=926566 RepID=I3ZIU3_TERRK|nr:LacI family DNA-binding transcriptional regulator [Terriglobus roseus]AFL89161.1 transcriptional regulator [Terriglobus roseus DSM 18391]